MQEGVKGVKMTYQPVFIEGESRPGRWCITCDHAHATVPEFVNGGDLGLPAADMARHIAFDIGALGVARALGAALDSPVIWSNFSRLVIDPNRGEDDPTLMMRLYDGTLIPANRHAGPQELQERLQRCYHPYHTAVGELMARPNAVHLSIHSFTPQLKGRAPRPWQIGILSAHDKRLTDPLLARLTREPDLTVGDNEPYWGHLRGDAVDRHALQHGRPNALIELRQDLIAKEADQLDWANRLAPILDETLAATNL